MKIGGGIAETCSKHFRSCGSGDKQLVTCVQTQGAWAPIGVSGVYFEETTNEIQSEPPIESGDYISFDLFYTFTSKYVGKNKVYTLPR